MCPVRDSECWRFICLFSDGIARKVNPNKLPIVKMVHKIHHKNKHKQTNKRKHKKRESFFLSFTSKFLSVVIASNETETIPKMNKTRLKDIRFRRRTKSYDSISLMPVRT